jgi:methylmalonyl-CoA/ethylmalonyl-CoA epimerase
VIRRIHHIGVAVESLDRARELYVEKLGLREGERDEVPEQMVRVLVVYAGETRIELLEPTSSESPIAKFLAKRGPGVHHIAYHVDDVAAGLNLLGERGLALIDAAPRDGAHHTSVGFVHPKATAGVLTELVQDLH